MKRETKDKDSTPKLNLLDLGLPLSLYLPFAHIAGVPIKLCGTDGHLLPDAPAIPLVGPCAILSRDDAFCETCADNHAAAASMAVELRRPYIYNCHMRLASWAIPILQNNDPLPVVIICGGVLLSEPDVALIRHLKSIADGHKLDPDELVQSLESVPVFSREQVRAIADFLFQVSCAFASYASLPGASEVVAPLPTPDVPPTPLVVPPSRVKETRKARQERARLLERRNVETEIVRLFKDRKPESAQEVLRELLKEQNAAGEKLASILTMAETFTRLFRSLSKGSRVSQALLQKQARLIHDVMSGHISVEQARRKFIPLAEEMTGEPRPRKIKAIQKFVEKNLAKKFTLETVGNKFGLRPKPLDALIRKHCGTGFTDYVSLVRISEAKRLLLTTDLNVGEIARRTGFSDQGYFTKVLKSKLGLTPTEFRQKNANRRGARNSADEKT